MSIDKSTNTTQNAHFWQNIRLYWHMLNLFYTWPKTKINIVDNILHWNENSIIVYKIHVYKCWKLHFKVWQVIQTWKKLICCYTHFNNYKYFHDNVHTFPCVPINFFNIKISVSSWASKGTAALQARPTRFHILRRWFLSPN